MSFLLGLVLGVFVGGLGGVFLAALLAGAARADALREKPGPGRLPGSPQGASSPGPGSKEDGRPVV